MATLAPITNTDPIYKPHPYSTEGDRCPIHGEGEHATDCPDGCPGAEGLTSQLITAATETDDHRNRAGFLRRALDQWDGNRLAALAVLTPVEIDEAVQSAGLRFPALDGSMVASVLLHLLADRLNAAECRLSELALHLGKLESGAAVTEVSA